MKKTTVPWYHVIIIMGILGLTTIGYAQVTPCNNPEECVSGFCADDNICAYKVNHAGTFLKTGTSESCTWPTTNATVIDLHAEGIYAGDTVILHERGWANWNCTSGGCWMRLMTVVFSTSHDLLPNLDEVNRIPGALSALYPNGEPVCPIVSNPNPLCQVGSNDIEEDLLVWRCELPESCDEYEVVVIVPEEAAFLFAGTQDPNPVDNYDDGQFGLRFIQLTSDCNTDCTSDTGNMDFNGDGTVNLDDFPDFINCLNGPTFYTDPCCILGDSDEDGDVDLKDFAQFQILIQ